MLTQKTLHDRYIYKPIEGVFRNKYTLSPKALIGDIAGCTEANGYRTIRINKKQYNYTHMIWLYVYGRLPNGTIDHINGDRSDNRLTNLREVSLSENSHNKPIKGKGYKVTANGKYISVIKKNGKQTYLGTYNTPEEATAAYLAVKQPLVFR